MAGAKWEDEDSSESEADSSEPEPSSLESSGVDDSMDEDEAGEAAEEASDGGGGGAAERPATQVELDERRQQNIHALVSGAGLALKRTSLMPRLGLTVQQAAVVLRRPFKSPHPTAPAVSSALRRKLAARKTFVPWGGGAFVPLKLKAPPRELLGLPEEATGQGAALAAPAAEAAVVLPPGVEPLVLWEPPPGEQGQPVRVDDMLTQVGTLSALLCAGGTGLGGWLGGRGWLAWGGCGQSAVVAEICSRQGSLCRARFRATACTPAAARSSCAPTSAKACSSCLSASPACAHSRGKVSRSREGGDGRGRPGEKALGALSRLGCGWRASYAPPPLLGDSLLAALHPADVVVQGASWRMTWAWCGVAWPCAETVPAVQNSRSC